MQWTVAYYKYKSSEWFSALTKFPNMSAGAAAYAWKKSAMWTGLANFAENLFTRNNGQHNV